MKIPFASSASGSKGSAVFALSNLLLDKTKRSISSTSDLAVTQLQARLSRMAGNWAQSGTIDARMEDVDKDWLITRCPTGRIARLDREGRCFCGTIADTESTLCEGFDENDRRTVCVEDLRDISKQADIAVEKNLSRRKEATCGIEFLDGFEPKSCPIGFLRIGQESEDDSSHFICQDSASPYSCGAQQVNCYAQEGVLRTQCKEQVCEPLMCKEGWRFRLAEVDDGSNEGTMLVSSQCVKSKPLFFNSENARS